MKVVLLQCTPEPERMVALAARLCYSPSGIGDLRRDVSRKSVQGLVRKVLSMGHASTLEHVTFTFGIEGISRAASHQLVRHRLASYSQQSQRYVSADFGYVTPGSVSDQPKLLVEYRRHMAASVALYEKLGKAGIPAEDARFVLPNATETKILVTMNARELCHFFSLRTCRRAQWEIREMALRMLAIARKKAPLLFENSGPGCVRGECPEKEMSCGHSARARSEIAAIGKNKKCDDAG
ncbi:MAG: FAD-dependent thymidylate synthase [Syntrophorhabdaceae bacterium]|nr:FAD-dependent thymidylate synthase [Syntrophorhabdaceae bacterium]